MVNTRSMAAQLDHDNEVDGPRTSVSDRAHPETPRFGALERRIQGLTTDVQLLMEQNREIIMELRGRSEMSEDVSIGQTRPHGHASRD